MKVVVSITFNQASDVITALKQLWSKCGGRPHGLFNTVHTEWSRRQMVFYRGQAAKNKPIFSLLPHVLLLILWHSIFITFSPSSLSSLRYLQKDEYVFFSPICLLLLELYLLYLLKNISMCLWILLCLRS